MITQASGKAKWGTRREKRSEKANTLPPLQDSQI
jgi:hypothetical protein